MRSEPINVRYGSDLILQDYTDTTLNEQAAMKVEKSDEEAKGSEEYRALVEMLRKDLGMC